MGYSINQLAKLAGVSSRTLRYYDEIKLLSPGRSSSNGYRIYGRREVDRLQRIMFFRELGVPLEGIKHILESEETDGVKTLKGHLLELQAKKAQLERLIANVEKTIAASKGEISMSDREKFEGFKQRMVDDNEKRYGREIRDKYGETAVKASNEKLMGLTQEAYGRVEELSKKINESLKTACEAGDPSSDLSQEVCRLHREWLGYYWRHYSKEAHFGLAQTYREDPRFRAYYEAICEGCAEFFYQAIKRYCEN